MLQGVSRPARLLCVLLLLVTIAGCFVLLGQAQTAQADLLVRRSLRAAIVAFSLFAWYLTQALVRDRPTPSQALATCYTRGRRRATVTFTSIPAAPT